jgi:hypothetical protein
MQRFLASFFWLLLLSSIFWVACQPNPTANTATPPAVFQYTAAGNIAFAKEILSLLKQKNFTALSEKIHPDEGLIFSPYSYVDTSAQKFTRQRFLEMVNATKPTTLLWGYYDGSGDPITLIWSEYYTHFIYDADFKNAPQISNNQVLGKGNSLINFDQVFPGSQFVESHFPGTNKAYEGMDWRSLRLVFKEKGGQLYLVGVVHDQWTI